MRLWSLHPKYLDSQGLVALWREGLLAQKVLAGKTRGYKHHPQLIRFYKMKDPLISIGSYLHFVEKEAKARGYQFDRRKILKIPKRTMTRIKVTRGQVAYETKHLLNKLTKRSPEVFKKWAKSSPFKCHPCFKVVPGKIEPWEKSK